MMIVRWELENAGGEVSVVVGSGVVHLCNCLTWGLLVEGRTHHGTAVGGPIRLMMTWLSHARGGVRGVLGIGVTRRESYTGFLLAKQFRLLLRLSNISKVLKLRVKMEEFTRYSTTK